MPKEYPPIPEEMPKPAVEPEIKENDVPETPNVPDEPPVVIPDEQPAPEIPEEMPDLGEGITGISGSFI